MKKKVLAFTFALTLLILCLCAFQINESSSLKELTHPYINTYVCTDARLGQENLLEKYDYFTVTLLNEKELEVAFKKKGGNKVKHKCEYTFDEDTHELTAQIGILGYQFKQTTKIDGGKFTVSLVILNKPLIMNFAVK